MEKGTYNEHSETKEAAQDEFSVGRLDFDLAQGTRRDVLRAGQLRCNEQWERNG